MRLGSRPNSCELTDKYPKLLWTPLLFIHIWRFCYYVFCRHILQLPQVGE